MRLRFTTAGESHGRGLVALVEGLPAGLPITVDELGNTVTVTLPERNVVLSIYSTRRNLPRSPGSRSRRISAKTRMSSA